MSLRVDRNADDPLRIRRNFQRIRTDALSASNFVFGETPAGTVNGINDTFTLARPPRPPTSLAVYQNGLLLQLTTDYTLSGSTLTFVVPPPISSVLQVNYLKR